MLSRFSFSFVLLLVLNIGLLAAASPISEQWDSLRRLDEIDPGLRAWQWNRLYKRRCMLACRVVDPTVTVSSSEAAVTPTTIPFKEISSPVATYSSPAATSTDTSSTPLPSSASPPGSLSTGTPEPDVVESVTSPPASPPPSASANAGQPSSTSSAVHISPRYLSVLCAGATLLALIL
ncbi:hypothetical protein JAAARDRAFT_546924 [Jaapia argillacea MUCL 33604]|uniref:Uncharacterized protein n=1 Tax=Jaapia argillacea MUCL 33604 TaxID=933084 RepID=A0A067PAT7_9AGAM|nr:hypothetical protein JAAARDRAFT_546924 [Jaapia argillacea MUCL 33604]